MTLEELKLKLGPDLLPWAEKYGPTILTMGAADLMAFIELALKGDQAAAYAAVLAKMPAGDLLAEWDNAHADWGAANKANALRIATQKEALAAVVSILLKIVTAALGLAVLL